MTALESGEIEVQVRRGRSEGAPLALDAQDGELIRAVDELWQGLP